MQVECLLLNGSVEGSCELHGKCCCAILYLGAFQVPTGIYSRQNSTHMHKLSFNAEILSSLLQKKIVRNISTHDSDRSLALKPNPTDIENGGFGGEGERIL